MQLFDSHCHFDFPAFNGQQQKLWRECHDHHIDFLTIPGTCPEQWTGAAGLADELDGVFYACGLHPWWVDDFTGTKDELADNIHDFVTNYRPVAIGECGLDAAIQTHHDLQEDFFDLQVALACELDMPLIIHVRKSHNPVIRTLKHYRPQRGGVIHGFSGSTELARQYWEMGFYLGIGGTITYPRARKTITAVREMPLEALLLETDAPDMPLNGQQGESNRPINVLHVAERLAILRDTPLKIIARQTTDNAHQLFGTAHV